MSAHGCRYCGHGDEEEAIKDARIKELEEALYRVVQATRDGPLLPDGVIQQCRDVSNRPDRDVP